MAREYFLERNNRNLPDHLIGEGIHQQLAGTVSINAATLQIEDLVGFELADGSSVGAFDVICHNFELRLSIDSGFGREQQIAIELSGIGELSRLGHIDLAVKHAMCPVIHNAFMQLASYAVGLGQGNHAVSISQLIAAQYCQTVQRRVRLLTSLIDFEMVPR